MRLTTFTAAMLLLAFVQASIVADDKPAPKDDTQTYTDDFWGFSFTHKGLEVPTPGSKVTAFRAEVDGDSGGHLLIYRRVEKKSAKDSVTETMQGLAKMFEVTAEETVECKVAGLKAWKSRAISGDRKSRHLLIYTDAGPNEPCWALNWQADSKATDENEKLVNAAIESFRLYNAGETPESTPDLQYCTRMRCSVVTAGFKGKTEILPAASLASASHMQKKADGEEAIGLILVGLANFGTNRKDGVEAFRKRRERFEKDFEFKELEVCGREAVRVSSKYGIKDIDPKAKRERLLIWDGDLCWEVMVDYLNDLAKIPAEFEEALTSFKLLNPAPEKPK